MKPNSCSCLYKIVEFTELCDGIGLVGVTDSEAMFLCLHTSLLYSNGNGCSLVEH